MGTIGGKLLGRNGGLSRRGLLKTAGAAGLGLSTGLFSPAILHAAEPKKIKLAWFPNAACLSPVAAAQHRGIFTKHNLDVEFVNLAGTTDQLLEALSTGKADASVGMALRWLKPLEQGFDVRLTTGTHGGCLRLLGSKDAKVTSYESLKGKTIAVTDQSSPAKNFFSIVLLKRGIDPTRDIDWRQYPADLLPLAVEKGEAHAIAHQDPDTFRFLKKTDLVEIGTNLSDEYAHRVCCVLGIRGSLLREDRPTAAAITRALLEAQDLTAAHPEQTAESYAPYVANTSQEDIVALLKTHTHGEHALGPVLRHQLAQYTDELKLVSVIRPTTDSVKFAEKITEDVLS
ncbi:ABC transporter substrate-binding protein [Telmatospirillum siberiense]|uniref:ABC transporter substrate-binding protein n=1 Tax=Telmatospirillum siberiense TaxID=382514 RepID=A0A2N3PX04_9PROT|nr:ABC transporter substrate-binding protein [Telmatospirillum siberiense]PKU24944.1 ABC transporter substrate-binding protein [Telmatospirillum siberiense]